MFQRYIDWMDEEVGWIGDTFDTIFTRLIPIAMMVAGVLYFGFGWLVIVVVGTPIAAIRTLCRKLFR